jgi:hypothetical protein
MLLKIEEQKGPPVSLCISAELHEFALRSTRQPCAAAYSVSLISALEDILSGIDACGDISGREEKRA